MKFLPLVTSASLVLLLAQSAPAKQVSRPVQAAPSIAAAQTKFCQEWAAQQQSLNKGGDRRAKLMAEARKPPRKSTMGKALREFYPGGEATLSDHPDDNEIVFISTSLEKGESGAIMKAPFETSYVCPNTYTLIKSISDGKGHPFMAEYMLIYLP
jgi:hypothetical protein